MCGLSTDTDRRSSSAATSLISATVWALLSPPSSEANTVSLTGPPRRSNSFRTACSSCAERKAMAAIIPSGAGRRAVRSPARLGAAPALRRGRGRPAHDLEHAPVARRVDAGVDQARTGGGERRGERAREAGLVLGGEDGEAEGPAEGPDVGAAVAHGRPRIALLLLLDRDQRQRLVVEDHDDDRQAEPRGRLELGGHHH